jgi:hypothetical protein
MEYLHKDLGHLDGDEAVEVTLDSAANVKLMDSANFIAYRRGAKHSYFGGHVTRSPFRLAVPRSGHWHVAVDLGGYRGNVRAGIRVLS